jgi:hypothetical protein
MIFSVIQFSRLYIHGVPPQVRITMLSLLSVVLLAPLEVSNSFPRAETKTSECGHLWTGNLWLIMCTYILIGF